jgi:predicted nucleic acid-binding protein
MVDANILFAAVGWKRWPYHVLRHAAAGDYQLVLSEQIIEEATEEVAAKLPDKSSWRMAALLRVCRGSAGRGPTA